MTRTLSELNCDAAGPSLPLPWNLSHKGKESIQLTQNLQFLINLIIHSSECKGFTCFYLIFKECSPYTLILFMSWNKKENNAYCSADVIWCITLVFKRNKMHKTDWSEMVKDTEATCKRKPALKQNGP